MYKSRILSIKALCVVVNLLFVCETWQSGWKKLVSESGEGETRKLWISFNSLPHSLHLIRTKNDWFSVLKILENIWGCENSFQRAPSMVLVHHWVQWLYYVFLKAFQVIFYKLFKNVFGMFYVCITGHLACIRASADSQRPMLKGLSRKPGRQLWISWPKGNCPGKCIFRTQLRMQKLLFIGLDWKAKQKTNSPCFFSVSLLCLTQSENQFELPVASRQWNRGQLSSGSASLCATG